MTEIYKIDLRGRVPGGASIEFLRAEMPAEYRFPLALIRYSLRGVEQEHGLRLDLDKQVFLDHIEDEEKEETIKQAAPQIVDYLSLVLYAKVESTRP